MLILIKQIVKIYCQVSRLLWKREGLRISDLRDKNHFLKVSIESQFKIGKIIVIFVV